MPHCFILWATFGWVWSWCWMCVPYRPRLGQTQGAHLLPQGHSQDFLTKTFFLTALRKCYPVVKLLVYLSCELPWKQKIQKSSFFIVFRQWLLITTSFSIPCLWPHAQSSSWPRACDQRYGMKEVFFLGILRGFWVGKLIFNACQNSFYRVFDESWRIELLLTEGKILCTGRNKYNIYKQSCRLKF